ncbi:MAG: hypothetical protein WCJ30_07025, partial [Deltaproteobacteria bacterium]
GLNCGTYPDGCGGMITCGSGTCPAGQICGAALPSECGVVPTVCVPRTTCPAGLNCGTYSNGCGGTVNCGSCAAGQICGLSGMPNVCGVPMACRPATTCPAGITCGPWPDGCGGVVASCGTCTAPAICGGGGVPSSCGGGSSGDGGAASSCPPGVNTTITGTVTAPGHDNTALWGTPDPLPGAVVYIPSGPVGPLPSGVSCAQCTTSAPALVQTTSATDGTFRLVNPPCGTNITLVIQLGLWRRVVTLPSVACCANTALPNAQTHLPRNHLEGDIPLIAVVTGSADSVECALPKIGIDTGTNGGTVNEFTDATGTGRVRFFRGNGATISGATSPWTALYGSAPTLSQYNLVIADCWGAPRDESAYYTAPMTQNLINYSSAGGRIYATHFEYSMLHGQNATAPPALNTFWNGTATWNLRQANPPDLNAFIDTAFPKGLLFAQWLAQPAVGASTTLGRVPVQQVRHDFDAVNSCGPRPYTPGSVCAPPSQLWMYADPAVSPNTPIQYTFNTPVGAPAASQCGRVMFSDFHVYGTGGASFPSECGAPGPMTPQEKVLEFFLFDLTSCITPDVPVCHPRTACPAGLNCGLYPDGCGGTISCGTCTAPDSCGGGGASNVCGRPMCTPTTTCPAGLNCGLISNGCGGTVNCGTCPAGQVCGLRMPNVCSPPGGCIRLTACPAGLNCGTYADGCGGTINCGTCAPPDTCGGGGTPSVCGHHPCAPTTCAAQSATCGLIGDGCGGTIDCGPCPAGLSCGGAGVPNMCGLRVCTPSVACPAGVNCGPSADGCGGTINCGTCTLPDTCGGGGVASQCGHIACVPTTCAAQHANCGPIGDGCGGTIDCGGCDVDKCGTCGLSVCTCGGGAVPSQCGCIQ